MFGVMALGRLVEAAEVVVAEPVTVLVEGATIMVVGNQEAEESVMVDVASKLVPYVSDDVVAVVSLAEVTELEAVVVMGTVVSVDSVSEDVMFGGNVTVADKLEVKVPVSAKVEFSETVSVGTIEEVK